MIIMIGGTFDGSGEVNVENDIDLCSCAGRHQLTSHGVFWWSLTSPVICSCYFMPKFPFRSSISERDLFLLHSHTQAEAYAHSICILFVNIGDPQSVPMERALDKTGAPWKSLGRLIPRIMHLARGRGFMSCCQLLLTSLVNFIIFLTDSLWLMSVDMKFIPRAADYQRIKRIRRINQVKETLYRVKLEYSERKCEEYRWPVQNSKCLYRVCVLFSYCHSSSDGNCYLS